MMATRGGSDGWSHPASVFVDAEGAVRAANGVPLPRPLPARSSRRGENSIALRTSGSRHPSPTQFVGEGPGMGGGSPSRTSPIRN
jgi:hypothetical protein